MKRFNKYLHSALTLILLFTFTSMIMFSSFAVPLITSAASTNVITLSMQIDLPSLEIFKDGATENITLDTAPTIVGARTFLPIRQVVVALGGTINWDASNQRVDISQGVNNISLWIGNAYARKNGTDVLIDPTDPSVLPYIAPAGRVMMPIRFISESLGAKVDWLSETRTILITYEQPEIIPSPTQVPTDSPKYTPTPAPIPTPTLAPGVNTALKLTATTSGKTTPSKFWYWKISTEPYTFQVGDYIEYDVYLDNVNSGLGAIEINCTDNSHFRDQSDWRDTENISGHPGYDISGFAYKQWYHRKLPIPQSGIGKTSADWDIAVEANSTNTTYVVYYDNFVVTNGGSEVKTIYKNGNPAVNVSRGGVEYTCSVDVVAAPASVPTPTPEPDPTLPTGPEPTPVPVVDSTSITDKVIAGYQGWFAAAGDGSPRNSWVHWSGGKTPSKGNLSFEVFPDLTDYINLNIPLFNTAFAPLGNGRPAQLFSPHTEGVVDQHFNWMKTYGIDGIALQRFETGIRKPGNSLNQNNNITSKVKAAAEKYGRTFYIMYDVSGAGEYSTFDTEIMNDWTTYMSSYTASNRYAHQDGKAVVCLWGFGFKDGNNPNRYPSNTTKIINLINWFKNNQECFVIGGVPDGWRECTNGQTGFKEVYRSYNMVSPWTIGRYNSKASSDNWKNTNILPDMQYCLDNNMNYQSVIFPGFSWSNWNGGPQNSIKRNAGSFFWNQAYNVKSAINQKTGINSGMYIAMFDEYDEGTAIAKAAEDSSMIPTDQYFVTLSADGTYVSSDFYLRLAGKATRMIKGQFPLVRNIPIPYSNGPVFFRTSLEQGFDAKMNWINTIDTNAGGISNVVGLSGSGTPICTAVSGEKSNRGTYSLKCAGQTISATNAYAYFDAFDVDIPVTDETKLSFWMQPMQELGRYVSIDLIMTDGTTLKDSGALDYTGKSMQAGTGHGTVGTWTQVKSDIGKWLNGKTIDKILVAYDKASASGTFTAYIDDIVITTGAIGY